MGEVYDHAMKKYIASAPIGTHSVHCLIVCSYSSTVVLDVLVLLGIALWCGLLNMYTQCSCSTLINLALDSYMPYSVPTVHLHVFVCVYVVCTVYVVMMVYIPVGINHVGKRNGGVLISCSMIEYQKMGILS